MEMGVEVGWGSEEGEEGGNARAGPACSEGSLRQLVGALHGESSGLNSTLLGKSQQSLGLFHYL